MGFGAAPCFALVLLVIMVRWDLRKHIWFWLVILSAMLLQIPIVVLIPWGNRDITGISILPVAALDYGIVYGGIKLIERLMNRSNNDRVLTPEVNKPVAGGSPPNRT